MGSLVSGWVFLYFFLSVTVRRMHDACWPKIPQLVDGKIPKRGKPRYRQMRKVMSRTSASSVVKRLTYNASRFPSGIPPVSVITRGGAAGGLGGPWNSDVALHPKILLFIFSSRRKVWNKSTTVSASSCKGKKRRIHACKWMIFLYCCNTCRVSP